MIAFVLSGGGNRGAAQVGALAALLERGITPGLIVGTSVGALNGTSLAAEPTAENAQRLWSNWQRIRREDIFPGNPLTASWRILTHQGSLHDRRNFRRFVLSMMPDAELRFRDLRVPSVVTATMLATGRLRLFGPRTDECVLDALLASTAIPPYFPPYQYQNEWLVDGAVVMNLPLNIAVANGARTIYVLEIADESLTVSGRSVSQTMAYAVRAMISQQHELERRIVQLERRGITVHPIKLVAGYELAYNDFRHTTTLLEEGHRAASAYLDALPAERLSAYQRLAHLLRSSLQRAVVQRFQGGASAPRASG